MQFTSFSDSIMFFKALFLMYSLSLPTINHHASMQRFIFHIKINYMLIVSKSTESLSVSLVANMDNRWSLIFVLFVWSYFQVNSGHSGLFLLVPTYSGLLRLFPCRSIFYKRRLYRMFWFANLFKMNFMLDFKTKWGKSWASDITK